MTILSQNLVLFWPIYHKIWCCFDRFITKSGVISAISSQNLVFSGLRAFIVFPVSNFHFFQKHTILYGNVTSTHYRALNYMKNHLFTILLALLAVSAFAQVPPKPSEKAVVYDYADMLTPEDKVSIELMGLKLQSKYDSKLLFISVETKGNMKGVDFVRAIYSGWGISDGVKGHCGIIVVCKKQIMAGAGGGFLVKCDNALTMKIKDSFQELLDKTTLPPFANVDDQNQQKGSAALKDSYMFFANAIIALGKEETAAKAQTADSTATAAESVAQAINQSSEKPPQTTAASPTPHAATASQPRQNDGVTQADIPQTTTDRPVRKFVNKIVLAICGLFFACINGIFFLFNNKRSHTPNNKKQYKPKDYDSNDYRDDH